jgi:biopolymer transport protein ExbD
LNNQAVDLESLSARLAEMKRVNPDVAVVIRPDRDLPVQKLITLMDALQRAQIMKVGIATRAEAK